MIIKLLGVYRAGLGVTPFGVAKILCADGIAKFTSSMKLTIGYRFTIIPGVGVRYQGFQGFTIHLFRQRQPRNVGKCWIHIDQLYTSGNALAILGSVRINDNKRDAGRGFEIWCVCTTCRDLRADSRDLTIGR